MMNLIPYGVCALCLIVGIKGSVQNSINEGDVKSSLNRMLYYFSIFIAFITISINLDKVIIWILSVSSNYFNFDKRQSEIFRILALIIIYFVIQIIVYNLFKLLSRLLFGKDGVKSSRGGIIFLSSIFGLIKGFIAILIMFIGLITYNITIGSELPVNIFNNIEGYNNLQTIIVRKKPTIEYSDTDKFTPANNVLVYYNGVTLEDGIKSIDAIDNKAIDITRTNKGGREKARSIYVWVGSNISYDFTKAERALKYEDTGNSGAIEAWDTRKGICFDYACLYVAMAREVGLKVRLVTGSGFDGKQYGPHAWNEVYLEDEGIWIPVDTTFYMAGDYFDSESFYSDHIKDTIAGEW